MQAYALQHGVLASHSFVNMVNKTGGFLPSAPMTAPMVTVSWPAISPASRKKKARLN